MKTGGDFDPGNLQCRWAPCERTLEFNQGRLPEKSLSPGNTTPAAKHRTPEAYIVPRTPPRQREFAIAPKAGLNSVRRVATSRCRMTIQFTGTDSYVADKDLMAAVNAAIRLERPLPVKGEPGGGKTELAR